MGRDENDHGLGRCREKAGEEFQPRGIGQLLVEQDEVGSARLLQRLRAGGDVTDGPVTGMGQDAEQETGDGLIVVDHQDAEILRVGLEVRREGQESVSAWFGRDASARVTTAVRAACTSGSSTVPTRSPSRSTATGSGICS